MPQAVFGDRSLFPHLDCHAYLAHAAISPLSAPVCDRIAEICASYGRGGMAGFVEWAPKLEVVRDQLATLIGASASELAFVSNTSHGVIDIAFGLRWRPGDRVLLFEGEFPANVTPWQQAAAEFGLELVWVSLEPFARSAEEGLAAVDKELARGVRLVAMSAVQYRTGLRMPVEAVAELCVRHDAELFVDAIQALGATPLDVSCGIDYLSAGSHKHLMGAEGAGLLFVSDRRAASCVPRLAGWLSHRDPVAFLIGDESQLRYDQPLQHGAGAFQIGTSNAIGLAALGASLELIAQLGPSAIHAHANRYLDALETGLLERGFVSHRASSPSARSTLLAVSPPPEFPLTAVCKALGQLGVVCNTPDGLMRLSPHWPNALDEVQGVLGRVDEALAGMRA